MARFQNTSDMQDYVTSQTTPPASSVSGATSGIRGALNGRGLPGTVDALRSTHIINAGLRPPAAPAAPVDITGTPNELGDATYSGVYGAPKPFLAPGANGSGTQVNWAGMMSRDTTAASPAAAPVAPLSSLTSDAQRNQFIQAEQAQPTPMQPVAPTVGNATSGLRGVMSISGVPGASAVMDADGNIGETAAFKQANAKYAAAHPEQVNGGVMNIIPARTDPGSPQDIADRAGQPGGLKLKTAEDFAHVYGGDLSGINYGYAQHLANMQNKSTIEGMNAQSAAAQHAGVGLRNAAAAQKDLAEANFYNQRGPAMQAKLDAHTQEMQDLHNTYRERIKEGTDKEVIKAVLGDPKQAPQFHLLGQNLDNYGAAQTLASQNGWVFKNAGEVTQKHMFGNDKAESAGWYDAKGNKVDMLRATQDYNKKTAAPGKQSQ